MKRRRYLRALGAGGVIGAGGLAGCSALAERERTLDAEEFETEEIDGTGIRFREGDRELLTFSVVHWKTRVSRYTFNVDSILHDDVEWASLDVVFDFPTDEFRPPDLYLASDNVIPPTSLDRRQGDEATVVDVRRQERTNLSLDFAAFPHYDYEGDYPVTVNVQVTLHEPGDFGIRDTTHRGEASFSTVIERWKEE